MKKPHKQTSILNAFLQSDEDVKKLENGICDLLKENKPVTITGVNKATGLDKSIIRIVLPHYTDKKRCRLELRCSWVEKKNWELKAEKLDKSVSELAAQSITSINIYIGPSEQLQQEINEFITERVRFNNCVEQLAHCCLTSETSILI